MQTPKIDRLFVLGCGIGIAVGWVGLSAVSPPPPTPWHSPVEPREVAPTPVPAGVVEKDPLAALFTALASVESGGRDDAVGDHGLAIGRYQIHESYWLDAKMPSGTWSDVRDPAYAEAVMRAYWKRYAKSALQQADFETLARIHNGGPRGAAKHATDAYWSKVSKALHGDPK